MLAACNHLLLLHSSASSHGISLLASCAALFKLEKDAVRQKNLMLQSRLKSLGLELKEERGALE